MGVTTNQQLRDVAYATFGDENSPEQTDIVERGLGLTQTVLATLKPGTDADPGDNSGFWGLRVTQTVEVFEIRLVPSEDVAADESDYADVFVIADPCTPGSSATSLAQTSTSTDGWSQGVEVVMDPAVPVRIKQGFYFGLTTVKTGAGVVIPPLSVSVTYRIA